MSRFACYKPDGDIVSILVMDAGNINKNIPAGTKTVSVAGDVDHDTHYIKNGSAKKMTAFPDFQYSNGKISRVPIGTKVTWPDGVSTVVNDGMVTFKTNASVNLRFTFSHPKHFRFRTKVDYSAS